MLFERMRSIIPLRLRSLFHRADVERELDDELRDHIERQTAENITLGMTPGDARTAALRALGGIEYRKEQVRDTRRVRWLEDIAGDVAFAFRSLRRAPGFAATVIITLALGIGANTAMFTMLRGTLLRSLPNRDGERLVYLQQSAQGLDQQNLGFSVPEIADFRAASRTLAAIAEYSEFTLSMEGFDGQPRRVNAGLISGNYFSVLGLSPVLGRLIDESHDGVKASPVVVLSHPFWLEAFGGDTSVVGRTIRVNGKVAQILGVVQPTANYPARTELYANLVTSEHHISATMVTGRTHRMSDAFARLEPGVSMDRAREDVKRVAANMFAAHPESYDKASRFAITLSPMRQAVNARASRTFWLLMGAAAFVLLIACANVANLTLMRGVGREREMVVRAALGAGTLRLRRLLLVENLALTLVGGVFGVLVAFAGMKLLVSFAAQLSPRASEIRVDALVLAVGLVTSLVVAIVLSFMPRVGGQAKLAAPLSPASRRATMGRARRRVQGSLVVAQLAVCMILLTGAGLLVRTLTKLSNVETGVQTDRVLTMELPFDGAIESVLMQRAQNLAMLERMRDRVSQLPGVANVGLGSVVPLRNAFLAFDTKAEGVVVADGQPTPRGSLKGVDPQYFAATGIPLLKGRGIETTDVWGGAPIVVLNETFARQLFGDVDPIGRRIALTGEVLKFTPFSGGWRTVVGVVGDTRDKGLDGAPTPTMFHPFAQEMIFSAALVVRTSADPEALKTAVTGAIRETNPRQLIERMVTLEQVRDESFATRRLNAMFIAAFAVLALVIATVGIAGVLAFSVTARTAEIGIRMSFGATAARIRRMVLRQGGVLLASGLTLGIIGALFAAQLLRGMLFGVSPSDPVTLAAVATVLAAIGLAACWLPAARAARVDPMVALRSE